MDLLKTILVYMSLVYASTVTSADPALIDVYTAPTATPTAIVTEAPTTPVPTPTPTPAPTIDMTPNPEYKTLKSGDKGEEVRRLQTALTEYGYFTGTIDGAYGGQTRAAVIRFQTAHGLSADGIAGKRTLTILYESNEVRPAEGYVPPTATPQITPAPSIAPVDTVAVTPAPTAVITIQPTEEAATKAAAFVPISTNEVITENTDNEGTAESEEVTQAPLDAAVPEEANDYKILVEGIVIQNEDAKAYHPLMLGKKTYLPIIPLLESAGYNVLTNSSLDKDEIAFMTEDSYVLLTYEQDKVGTPVNLQVFKGNDPQVIQDRSIYEVNGTLYLSDETITAITGATIECLIENNQVAVTFNKTVSE